MKRSLAIIVSFLVSLLPIFILLKCIEAASAKPEVLELKDDQLKVADGIWSSKFIVGGVSITSSAGLVINNSAREILRIQGLNSGQWNEYTFPVNADEVVITLTTKDGKKYRAKWELVEEQISVSQPTTQK